MKLIDKNVYKVLHAYGSKNIVMMRELSYVCQTSDNEAAIWMALGLPMRGWSPFANGLMTRIKPPVETYHDWCTDRLIRNDKVLLTIRSSGDDALDTAAFCKPRMK